MYVSPNQQQQNNKPIFNMLSPEDTRIELRNTKIMLTAAIMSNGGMLVVKDEDIAKARDEHKVKRYNDGKNGQVVFSI